jgi:ADP-ribose pyrophosphatase YjhB (NUDIX family)
MHYENARPTVELALMHNNKLLITKRGIEPRKGFYDMPGGFTDLHETLEQALLREVKEELGLDSSDISTPQFVLSFNGPYPFGPEVLRSLVSLFYATLITEKNLVAQDDVAEVRWIDKKEVNDVPWALPVHKENAFKIFDLRHD